MVTEKQRRGAAAEQQALDYLRRQRLILLHRNYRSRYGEIDLVMQDGAVLVFVEVRYRPTHEAAAASIDVHKQRRLQSAAAHYLAAEDNPPACRFDAVLVDGGGGVEWLQDAFTADE